MEQLKYKNLDFQLMEVNEEEYTVKGIFSTSDTDRHGEIVDQKGWNFSNFLRNPVVLFAHDHYQPAIGKVISIGLNMQEQLEGVVKFAVEEYDFAKTIFQLIKGKYMGAFSAGFINNELDQREDGTIVLVKNELLEMSVVNVPANALALAKAKGIDTKALEDFQAKRERICKKQKETEETLESVKSDLEKVKSDIEQLQRSEPSNTAGGKKGKTFSVKKLNKIIRSLLKLNYQLKKTQNEQERKRN